MKFVEAIHFVPILLIHNEIHHFFVIRIATNVESKSLHRNAIVKVLLLLLASSL